MNFTLSIQQQQGKCLLCAKYSFYSRSSAFSSCSFNDNFRYVRYVNIFGLHHSNQNVNWTLCEDWMSTDNKLTLFERIMEIRGPALIAESGFLFTAVQERTWQTHRQQASKVFIKGKQMAPRDVGRGEEPPSLLSLRDFPLKGEERLQKDVVYSHWPCSVTFVSPCPVGALGVETSPKFSGFFVLVFPWMRSPFLPFLFCPLRSRLETRVSYGNKASGECTFPIIKEGLWRWYSLQPLSRRC